jgi:branched-chain amino acid transport system substrate-binding protein
VTNAWANTVNASGCLAGRPVQLTVDDDGGTPGTSVSDATTRIGAHLDVILDESPLDAAWTANAIAAHIPVV